MSVPDLILLRNDLIRDEGWKNEAYKDSLGKWTIGVGHYDPIKVVPGLIWTDEQVDAQLSSDMADKIAQCQTQGWWAGVKDDEVRARAMVNMCFQLGVYGVSKFRFMTNSIMHKDWGGASEEALSSTWATQTPARASRIAHMLEYGVDV